MNTPSDDKLNAALAKLPREIEPARDLWPGIATRIVRHNKPQWPRNIWRYAAAAAVVAAAIATAWVTLPSHTSVPGNQTVATTVPASRDIPTQAVDLLARFTAQLVSDTSMPPKARTVLVDNLNMVHADILQTQAAVKKYPNDVNLQTLLINLYQQQAQLMSEAQQAQIQTTARKDI